jgi:predicted ATPase
MSEDEVVQIAAREAGITTRTGNVELRGKYVAGRDLTITQYLQQRGPIVTSLFQLPPDISDFTGRSLVRDELLSLLKPDSEGTHAIVISSIAGVAGIGKTALAVHIAHKLASNYNDGQLYIDLRGAGEDRLDPSAVLGEFLRALGLEGRSIPDDMDERSRLYRAGLAHRRILVVLDNAASEAQVRPLLPGSASCGVIITSRRRLAALAGSRIYALDVLGQAEALELLRKICADDRVNEEPDAARQLVTLCGCLPLAIRIAGARLAQRSHWQIRHLVNILANEHQRLGALKVGDLEVRSSFSLSYDNEDAEVRRLFRLLGLIKTVDFAGWVAAPLLNCDQFTGEELVDRLVDAQLLDVTGRDVAGQTRYRFHDLLRVYARERLTEEEASESASAAERRLIAAYLRLAERAHVRQWPTGLRPEVRPSPRWP